MSIAAEVSKCFHPIPSHPIQLTQFRCLCLHHHSSPPKYDLSQYLQGLQLPPPFPPKKPNHNRFPRSLTHAPFLKNNSPTSTPASIISAITTAIATARSTSKESSSAHTLSSAASSSTSTGEHRGMCCCSVSR